MAHGSPLLLNLQLCIVEPVNKGHIGTRGFVHGVVSIIRRLKCTGIIGLGVSLYREMSFILNVLYQRFH